MGGGDLTRAIRPRAAALVAGLLAVTVACSGNPAPETGPAAADTADRDDAERLAFAEGEEQHPDSAVSRDSLREAARDEGVDEEEVLAADERTRRALQALEDRTRRQFESLFGDDPLGLSRTPRNAARYEIPLEMNRSVERWVDYFQRRVPRRFETYLERAGRYEPMIRAKLREAGMPEDLVYKALIESGMNTDAYSRARAVGLWQFMAGTARKYGLEVSYWMDERRDPVKSTDAAIRYLSDLYEEFGSWYLAAAAYNVGEGRVRWGMRRTGAKDFWALSESRAIPRETRNHVPKIIAASLIARSPAQYGFGRLDPAEPLRYDVVTVPEATSMDVLAEAAGVSEDRIRELNPEFRRNVTPPGREVQVKVPPGTASRFRTQYAQIPSEERVTWLTHRVTRGQTLSEIAGRYGTSVQAIVAANDGLSPRRLQIGQRLVVPRSGRPGDGGGRVEGRMDGPASVVVRRGDTLWDIASRHGVTTSQLMAWNGLRSSTIRPGDRITVRR